MREQAYANFSDLLLTMRIKPGQFLTQKELVSMTDMSLATVRELIPRLEADGLIKAIPQRGLQVTHIDMNLIKNAFELRLILEKRAIEHFAKHADDTQIDELLDEHLAILEQAKQEVTPSLIEQAQHADWHLHDAIITKLDNEIISNIYKVNAIKIRLIIADKSRIWPSNLERIFSEHLKILGALKRRDAEAAIVAMEQHILSAKQNAFSD